MTDPEGKTTQKAELEWTSSEDRLANNNSKALNAIFNAVNQTQFICPLFFFIFLIFFIKGVLA